MTGRWRIQLHVFAFGNLSSHPCRKCISGLGRNPSGGTTKHPVAKDIIFVRSTAEVRSEENKTDKFNVAFSVVDQSAPSHMKMTWPNGHPNFDMPEMCQTFCVLKVIHPECKNFPFLFPLVRLSILPVNGEKARDCIGCQRHGGWTKSVFKQRRVFSNGRQYSKCRKAFAKPK